jgi:hypothetical protein
MSETTAAPGIVKPSWKYATKLWKEQGFPSNVLGQLQIEIDDGKITKETAIAQLIEAGLVVPAPSIVPDPLPTEPPAPAEPVIDWENEVVGTPEPAAEPKAKKSELHTAALAYALTGRKIFPCHPATKKPATTHGFQDASNDPNQITDWWKENPEYNIGWEPGTKGLCVIDKDAYKPEFSQEAFDALKLPETHETATPRGGTHLTFKGSLPGTTAGKKHTLAPGVDSRGEASYVLLPPSVFEGKPYVVTKDRPYADLPAHISELLQKNASATTSHETRKDLPGSIVTAKRRLADRVKAGEVAISGKGGNNHTYEAVCELVRDLGLSADTSLSLLEELWNPHCNPPWSRAELQTFIVNAANHGQNEPGAYASAGPEEVFAGAKLDEKPADPLNIAEEYVAPLKVFEFLFPHQFQNRPSPRWIVDGILQEKKVHIIFGASQAFKTFLLLDLLASVAYNIPAFGKLEVYLTGDVILCADEDPDDLMSVRYPAWCKARGVVNPFANPTAGPGKFVILPEVPHMCSPTQVDQFIVSIAALNLKPIAIGIDTMRKSMVGANMDTAQDMGMFYAGLANLRRAFDCAPIATHHPLKYDEGTMSGSDAQMTDADIVHNVRRKGSSYELTWINQKMKSAVLTPPFGLSGKLFEVAGKVDQKGEQVVAPVFNATAAAPQARRSEKKVDPRTIKKVRIAHAIFEAIVTLYEEKAITRENSYTPGAIISILSARLPLDLFQEPGEESVTAPTEDDLSGKLKNFLGRHATDDEARDGLFRGLFAIIGKEGDKRWFPQPGWQDRRNQLAKLLHDLETD